MKYVFANWSAAQSFQESKFRLLRTASNDSPSTFGIGSKLIRVSLGLGKSPDSVMGKYEVGW